jgi:hypothetical protein
MTTLIVIAQLSNCLLTHMLLAYWRKLLDTPHAGLVPTNFLAASPPSGFEK